MITPGIDHIALNVPDLDAQIERLTTAVGLVVEHRFGDFALISDPTNGLKLELGRSEDDQVHFRHFGVRADDVDRAHQHLVDTGMETTLGAAPPRLRGDVHVVPAPGGMRRRPARQVRPARRPRRTRRAFTSRSVQGDRRSGLTCRTTRSPHRPPWPRSPSWVRAASAPRSWPYSGWPPRFSAPGPSHGRGVPPIGPPRPRPITAPRRSCSVCPLCSLAGSFLLPPTAVRAPATEWSVRLPPSSSGPSPSGSTGSPRRNAAAAPGSASSIELE